MLRRIVIITSVIVILALALSKLYHIVSKDFLNLRQKRAEIELPQPVSQYLNTLSQLLDSAHNVGAAVTIVQDDKVLVNRTFGIKEANTNDSVDIHTVFRLASVSKGFAGVLACLLEQDSVFLLDDKISTFLPDFKLKDTANTNNLTLLHTLSHTSGLVPHTFDNLIEDGVPLPLILQELVTVEISAPPGELYGYQNVVYSMIDTIVRIQTGYSYADILEKRIFRPLQMRDASATSKVFKKNNSNIALPHARTKNGFYALKPNLGYYNIAPAAGVNASISDMSTWLLALLGHKQEFIDSTITHRIATPVVQSPLKRRYTRRWGKVDEKYYSLGWRIYDYKGRRIVYHGGYVRGYRAEIAFCPEEKIGIAFLQNSPNWVASVSIPTFFNIYFNTPDSDSTQMQDNALLNGFEWYEDTFRNIYEY